MVDLIIEYISIFLALMLVLSIHEFAHGFVAVKCGDMTPKMYGRYTLNPLAHFDLVGLLCFMFVGFGWAKPVPINPNNFKHYRRGYFLVAIAGIVANYLLAFIAFPLGVLAYNYVPAFGKFSDVLMNTLFYVYSFSLSFAVFNLLPIYPLDGFRAVDAFAKKRGKIYRFLRNYGIYILYGLIFLGILADLTGFIYLDVLGFVVGKVVNIINLPINLFWGLIF